MQYYIVYFANGQFTYARLPRYSNLLETAKAVTHRDDIARIHEYSTNKRLYPVPEKHHVEQ